MIIEQLVEWRKTEDNMEVIAANPPDLIVPISYGAIDKDRLTLGTVQNINRAISLMRLFPDAKMIISSCSYLFADAGFREEILRSQIIQDAGLPDRTINARYMINSVGEAEAVREKAAQHRISADRIAIVTGPMHSRSARLIYQYTFPKSKIMIVCTNWRKEFQPHHRAPIQRTAWRWFFANEARYALLKTIGPERIKNLHHRTSVKS